MKLITIFDAVQNGTFEDFLSFYKGDPNEVFQSTKLNLLMMTVTEKTLLDDKFKIISFLIKEGIDINFLNKDQRNALHIFFQAKANWRPDLEYAIKVVQLLIESGINVNQVDKFGSIPLHYAITVLKLRTDAAEPLYRLLLNAGSDYNIKNEQGMSCLDYAKEYSWRNDLIQIMEEYDD